MEMFKVRMQGQYGDKSDKRLRDVAKEMWTQWGFRKGIMRGYWVRIRIFGCAHLDLTRLSQQITVAREIPAYARCVS